MSDEYCLDMYILISIPANDVAFCGIKNCWNVLAKYMYDDIVFVIVVPDEVSYCFEVPHQ